MKSLVFCFAAAALTLSGCDKPTVVDTCVAPTLAPPSDPANYLGQQQLAHACLKTAAFSIARKGGSVAAVADAALAQCAGKEADEIAALKRTGPVYPYQAAEVHDAIVHQARLAAVEARAKGCG